MKRLFFIFAAAIMAVGAMAQLKEPTADVRGNLKEYKFFYVVPTNGMTSSSGVAGNQYGVYGGGIKTINPSEAISGYLMKKGYNVISNIKPEMEERTLIVSYGYTGRRQVTVFSYASCIIIQMRNAQTQELVATFEAEGTGENETEGIYNAINRAMRMFQFSINPRVTYDIVENYKRSFTVELWNQTPAPVNIVNLKIIYLLDDEVVYEQSAQVKQAAIDPNRTTRVYITKEEPARNRKYKIEIEKIDYK
jgi:hypothetical protein